MPLLDLFADDDAPPAELDFALKGKKGAKGSGEGDGAGSKKVGGSAKSSTKPPSESLFPSSSFSSASTIAAVKGAAPTSHVARSGAAPPPTRPTRSSSRSGSGVFPASALDMSDDTGAGALIAEPGPNRQVPFGNSVAVLDIFGDESHPATNGILLGGGGKTSKTKSRKAKMNIFGDNPAQPVASSPSAAAAPALAVSAAPASLQKLKTNSNPTPTQQLAQPQPQLKQPQPQQHEQPEPRAASRAPVFEQSWEGVVALAQLLESGGSSSKAADIVQPLAEAAVASSMALPSAVDVRVRSLLAALHFSLSSNLGGQNHQQQQPASSLASLLEQLVAMDAEAAKAVKHQQVQIKAAGSNDGSGAGVFESSYPSDESKAAAVSAAAMYASDVAEVASLRSQIVALQARLEEKEKVVAAYIESKALKCKTSFAAAAAAQQQQQTDVGAGINQVGKQRLAELKAVRAATSALNALAHTVVELLSTSNHQQVQGTAGPPVGHKQGLGSGVTDTPVTLTMPSASAQNAMSSGGRAPPPRRTPASGPVVSSSASAADAAPAVLGQGTTAVAQPASTANVVPPPPSKAKAAKAAAAEPVVLGQKPLPPQQQQQQQERLHKQRQGTQEADHHNARRPSAPALLDLCGPAPAPMSAEERDTAEATQRATAAVAAWAKRNGGPSQARVYGSPLAAYLCCLRHLLPPSIFEKGNLAGMLPPAVSPDVVSSRLKASYFKVLKVVHPDKQAKGMAVYDKILLTELFQVLNGAAQAEEL